MIDGYYNNLTHTKGDDGERRVEEFCAKNNCLISRPTNQSFPYDLMVDYMAEYTLKVQVKQVTLLGTGLVNVPLTNRINAGSKRKGIGNSHSYLNTVDVMAVVVTDDNGEAVYDEPFFISCNTLTNDLDVPTTQGTKMFQTDKYVPSSTKAPLINQYTWANLINRLKEKDKELENEYSELKDIFNSFTAFLNRKYS